MRFKTQVESTKFRCKALKAMATKCIERRLLFLLYQSVILSVIDYGLGLTTLSQSNPQKLDRAQNEDVKVFMGTPTDAHTEAMRFLLDQLPMETRQG